MKPEIWISIYAAIVGTGALLLNFKNWFDGGVRLHLSLMPNAQITGGDASEDVNDIMAVTVTNRGGSPTTITHLFVLEFPSLWRRYRRRQSKAFFIPNPAPLHSVYQLPFELGPAKLWTGIAHKRFDVNPDLHNGRHYLAVYCSHRDKAYLARVPKKASQIPDTSKTIS
ncbi:MAG: hypothetical protein JWN14_4897 [Chthonomonadales bacterium]|nr:hypothetical protein [Chthonomonadales bacterium]